MSNGTYHSPLAASLKRILSFLLPVLFLLAIVLPSLGQAQTGTTSATTTTSTSTGGGTTTTTTTKHKAAAHHSVKGTVASVDATAKSFVVHPAKGADVTVKVNDRTKYKPKGKRWDDIKQDAKVSVTYKNDGTDNWAIAICFYPFC